MNEVSVIVAYKIYKPSLLGICLRKRGQISKVKVTRSKKTFLSVSWPDNKEQIIFSNSPILIGSYTSDTRTDLPVAVSWWYDTCFMV